MKQVSLIALLPLCLLGLAGCGDKYPRNFTLDGVKFEEVGAGWDAYGSKLSVLSRVCPWNGKAQAVHRWSPDGRENICLIFRKDGDVEQAFYEAGSLRITTLDWKWADGWPDKRLQPTRAEEDRARTQKPAPSDT